MIQVRLIFVLIKNNLQLIIYSGIIIVCIEIELILTTRICIYTYEDVILDSYEFNTNKHVSIYNKLFMFMSYVLCHIHDLLTHT